MILFRASVELCAAQNHALRKEVVSFWWQAAVRSFLHSICFWQYKALLNNFCVEAAHRQTEMKKV
jgi:predicted CoA-binding protein